MAMSYASLRTQSVTVAIARNAVLAATARQAALSGLAVAVKAIQSPGWSGVDSSLSRSLGVRDRFLATFTFGDTQPNAADVGEFPYRVTVTVLGEAFDEVASDRSSRSTMRLALRLIPRRVADPIAGWSDLTGYTLCQWKRAPCRVQSPCRILGPARLREKLVLGEDLPWHYEARASFFNGLTDLHYLGQGDYRPFSGPLTLPYSLQTGVTMAALNLNLEVFTINGSSNTACWWSVPVGLKNYQLYPGGPTFTAGSLSSGVLESLRLEGNPTTNPLGIYVASGTLECSRGIQFRGMLLLTGGKSADLLVTGGGNEFTSVEAPPYADPPRSKEVRVRLPAAILEDDLKVQPGGQILINGMIINGGDFVVEKAGQTASQFTLRGKLATAAIQIEPREDWIRNDSWWDQVHVAFVKQRLTGDPIFPRWLLQNHALDYRTKIELLPDTTSRTYHWFDPQFPLFLPRTEDATPLDGSAVLRWEVVRVETLPP